LKYFRCISICGLLETFESSSEFEVRHFKLSWCEVDAFDDQKLLLKVMLAECHLNHLPLELLPAICPYLPYAFAVGHVAFPFHPENVVEAKLPVWAQLAK
jgi:hypothetical protein